MATMRFSGKSLDLVRDALEMAILWNKTQIGSCPDVVKFQGYLDEIEAEIAQLEAFIVKIDRKLAVRKTP